MRGYITERDFELVDQAFPGIVRYYLELQDKPSTFLELCWAYTHRNCGCAESVQVATGPASQTVSR